MTLSWESVLATIVSDIITIAVVLIFFDVHFVPRWW